MIVEKSIGPEYNNSNELLYNAYHVLGTFQSSLHMLSH